MPTVTEENSAELWNAFRGGEARALAILFETYYDALYHYGLKLTGDEELVKDCIQNLFQKLWRRREGLRAVQVVKAYLFKALRRHLGDETKLLRQHRHLLPTYTDSFEVTYSHEEFLIAQQGDAEQSARLLAALNKLSKRQREALYLKFFDGFSYERIAEVMSLNTQSVRNLVFNALQTLRKMMVLALMLVLMLAK
ncbi:RNA polymerase sigma factor (sigma-70 family) [Hymenobacter sp. UYAg731]